MKLFPTADLAPRSALCARNLLVALVFGSIASCGGDPGSSEEEPDEREFRDTSGSQVLEIGEPTDESESVFVQLATDDGACAPVYTTNATLAEHVVDHQMPWTKVLYSWTSPEQEAGLREREELLTVGAIEEERRGLAMDLLADRAREDETSLEALVHASFEEFRYAWANPWATRIGLDGEDYGNRLIKMVLRDEAWLGMLSGEGSISAVYDQRGKEIPLEEAAESPGRIAVLFFFRESESGGPVCGGGIISAGENGYREFIVGNQAMLEEWSVGTTDILDRLNADIEALVEYAQLIRPCPPRNRFSHGFNHAVSCSWGSETEPYWSSLALPSEAYEPTPEHLFALIETLEGDRFEPDPLVVHPE